MSLRSNVLQYQKEYQALQQNEAQAKEREMPGKTFFISDGNILCMPREDGDSRYPFGQNGFNYWAYASGYIHTNEGLFSPFLRVSEGQEPKIAFFVGLKKAESYQVIPILSVPMMQEPEVNRYTVFTKASAYYIMETQENITFAVRTFVGEDQKIYFSLMVENHSGVEQNFFISSYFNPFLKHAVMEGAENRWFRRGSIVEQKEDNALNSLLIEVYEERERGCMAPQYGVLTRNLSLSKEARLIRVEETTSRNDYVGGVRSSLHTPQALYKGTFGNTKKVSAFTEIAIAGDLIHLELKQNGFARVDTVMTCCFEEDEKKLALLSSVIPPKIDALEEKGERIEVNKQVTMRAQFGKRIRGKIKEQVFNGFFEHLKKQVEFCAMIKGYIQLSNFSLIGIRDVYQALEALIFWEPEVARAKMLEGLHFIQRDGRCPRQYSLPRFEGDTPNMDLRPFIDQGVWVISTISTYLKLSGDFKFLEEMCGYYEFLNDKTHLAKKVNDQSTVLQHLFEIMAYLLENRDHEFTKCVCALYGDWNDALDGLGVTKKKDKEYGTGVSVMATLQVYQNCKEMIELLSRLDKDGYQDKIRTYQKARMEIEEGLKQYAVITNESQEKRIVHGWGDERSYLVGSFCDPDGLSRDGITSNAFWVLCGMYEQDSSIKNTLLQAYERLGSKYGLKTFEPHFEKGTFGVGRIPNLPKGTAENGAAYTHASTFGVMSLFRIGETKKAWEELEKCLPFTHQKISVSPYVMPNSYGYNEMLQIDGESMQDWQTGSSNVMLKTLIRFVFGIEPEYEGLWIQPSKDIPFEKMTFETIIKGCKVILNYVNTQSYKERSMFINGQQEKGIYDEVMGMNRLWITNKTLKESDKIIVEILD